MAAVDWQKDRRDIPLAASGDVGLLGITG